MNDKNRATEISAASTREHVEKLGTALHQKPTTYPIIIDTPVRSLPVKLTEKEIIAKCRELASVIQEIADEEQRQSNEKTEMKARLSKMDDLKLLLCRCITKGEEYRMVDVVVQLRDDGMIDEIRTDTGEVISNRPVKTTERQFAMTRLNVSKVDAKG